MLGAVMRRVLLALAVLLVSLVVAPPASATTYGNWSRVVSSDPRTSTFHCAGAWHGAGGVDIYECVVVSGTYWQGVTIFHPTSAQGVVTNDTEAWINGTLANTTTCTGSGNIPVGVWAECMTPTFHSSAGYWVQEQGGWLDANHPPGQPEWFYTPSSGLNSPTVQL